MDAIEILVAEHRPIKTVLKAIRKLCIGIVNGESVDHQLFTEIIDFVRGYADKYHHQKEEDHLFNIMTELADEPPNTGPITGMLVEHDLGRNYIRNLEKAIAAHKAGNEDARVDIIANAISYEQLLHGHIDKEDNVIYKMGTRIIPEDQLDQLTSLFNSIEEDPTNIVTRDKYIEFADSLKQSLNL
ncbi:MAG: hemerythrin domain-containing protein [Bacillota bacterium]|nr:hemerythrin domain-containing protein [Bacillota bacterium]